jgi:acyl-CoA synthetase (NDP forming)
LKIEFSRESASMRDLSKLFNPKSIAVVGASERFGPGSLVIENLSTLGYQGKIIPINPRYKTIQGLTCYPSLLAVPEEEKIDSIAILLGYQQIIPVLEQAAQRGIRGAWAFASGFAETGEEGVQIQEALRKLCLERNILFCGPNCVGYANLHGRVGMYSAQISPTLKKGRVSAIAQSGSVILALANSNRGVGFNLLISSGNEAVLDAADYLAYLLEDENTGVIITFLESIRRPDTFIQVCERAAELCKPIIMVKVGRSEMAQGAALTHTGALTGSDRVHDALFKKLGVIRVEDLDQLLETAEVFVRCQNRLPQGNGVGLITVSGGEIGLIGDLTERLSFSFPSLSVESQKELKKRLPPFTPISNPLDAWGSGDLAETYPACLEILGKEEGMDLIAISQDSPPGMAEKQVKQYTAVAKAAVRAASSGKPIIAFSHISGGLDPTIKRILDQGNIPFLQGTRESLLAIHHLVEYAHFLRRRNTHDKSWGQSPRDLKVIMQNRKGERRILPDGQAKEILRAYGIQVTKEILTKTVDQALETARQLGYPVVLKGQSPQIPHKTEAGLVRLNVRDEGELRISFDGIMRNARTHHPKAMMEGILIQEMIPAEAVEVIVGISRDVSFGPVIVFGLGGIWVELLKDTTLRLPPLNREDARSMISGIKGKSLLEGFRGREPADIDSLVQVLIQVGRMAVDLKEVIISLDLNPLMVLSGGKGVRAVDVVMEVGG